MFKPRKWLYLVGDFETTVYEGQDHTEVWASAVVPMYTEDVTIFHSIAETLEHLIKLKRDIIIYYHNLKFDGSFWLNHFISNTNYKQAAITQQDGKIIGFKDLEDMENGEYKYSISAKGQWYAITLKIGSRYIEFRDSLKLLPFSVEKIGSSFGTKHKKLQMNYEGYRYAGCEITDEEKTYIANDVLVVKEALEIMFNQGHKKLTIGSCCLSEYKNILKTTTSTTFENLFPNLYEIELPEGYGSDSVGEYIRKSYHGGWCYLVRGKENKIYNNGITADVNSLYPSMMHSESGNYYPYGPPKRIEKGKPKYILEQDFFFIRFRCKFKLKPNHLPTVQIKGNPLYPSTDWLETSDIIDARTGERYTHYIDLDGVERDTIVEFTMTQVDWKLFQDHYYISHLEYLDYIVFNSEIGLFDDYIAKYKKIKMESKGAVRELAKLFLNNLYGKFGASTDSSFKVVTKNPQGALVFDTVFEHKKEPGYIAAGTSITAYARNFTIRTAQANYNGPEQRGFIYADTDSIHCDLNHTELVDVPVHPTEFCHWALEASWDKGIFVRQKTYIEHVTHADLEPLDKPRYNVKCAGMPEKSKQLFIKSLNGEKPKDTMTESEKKFLSKQRTLKDFRIGLEVPDCLKARQINGGVLLINGTYKMNAR